MEGEPGTVLEGINQALPVLKKLFWPGTGPVQFVAWARAPVLHCAKNAFSTASISEKPASGSTSLFGQANFKERFEGSLSQAAFQLAKERVRPVSGGFSPFELSAAIPEHVAASRNKRCFTEIPPALPSKPARRSAFPGFQLKNHRVSSLLPWPEPGSPVQVVSRQFCLPALSEHRTARPAWCGAERLAFWHPLS